MEQRERFKRIIERLDEKSPLARDELDGLVRQRPMEFRTWALAWICRGGRGPRAHFLLRLLQEHDLLRSLLVNPGAMPLRDAIRVARLAQHCIKDLDWMVADTIHNGTVTQAARALQVLQHVPLTSRVVPGLAVALRSPNVKIRSLVSKLLGRMCDDPAPINALFRDEDPRVRANAIEGLWGSDHQTARDIMRRHLRDPDNRVAANAALGLYKCGDPDGIEALRAMSAHSALSHRISAAWAIGQTADPGLLPILENLACGRVPKLREAAQNAIAAIRDPAGFRGRGSLQVTVSQAYLSAQGQLQFRAIVSDLDDNLLESISHDSFRIFQGGKALPAGKVRLPARRDPFVTALLLDDQDFPQEIRTKAHHALLASLQYKRPNDLLCPVGSGSFKQALGFSADLGQLEAALQAAGSHNPAAPQWGAALTRAVALVSSHAGCPAVLALSSGQPPEQTLHVEELVEQALNRRVPVHAVVFAKDQVAPQWEQIVSQTQGQYQVLHDPDGFQQAFWAILSPLFAAYSITVQGVSVQDKEFRLEVLCGAGYGQTQFEPWTPADRPHLSGASV